MTDPRTEPPRPRAPRPRPVPEDGPRSLHRRILADIEGGILKGALPPGAQLPFEHELAARYGCSRMTVNKVMTRLVAAGLIERRRKAGTFVKHPQSRSAVLDIVDIKHEVEALGLAYGFEILRSLRRSGTAAESLRLGSAGPVDLVEIVACHFAAGQPFCLEERLISLAAVPEAATEVFDDLPPGAWLNARVPWSAAEHRIRAVGASAPVAAALMVARGTPCLRIERRTWGADGPITSVAITYPGEKHEIVARFAPA